LLFRFTRFFALKRRPHRARRWWSTTAGKTLPDFIKPFIKRVKSGMKALVVKVKYVADYDEAKKPVVMIQVADNPVGRIAQENKGFPQGTHLKPPPPRANAPVSEDRPIVTNATMQMILFRSI
jgi:hypothetical protein